MSTLAEARARAAALDADDPLTDHRRLFDLPDGVAYFDGNSLGPLTHAARAAVAAEIDGAWGTGLIRSWKGAGWLTLPHRTGARIGALVGAGEGTLLACDSTSTNLYKALTAAVRLRPGRTRLVIDADDFPTDRYLAASVAEQYGLELVAVPAAELAGVLDERVAALTATHVDYRSARLLDLPGLTAAAHAVGALTVWDLAHSAGAVPVDLDASGVDFAVGCGYKYLNGGPGAPAFVYVGPAVARVATQPLTGWFGHADPFAFDPVYRPAEGTDRFLGGTTGVLAMTALHAALDAFAGVGMDAVRAKSVSLTTLFVDLVAELLVPAGYTLASPTEAGERGSHVALGHPAGERVLAALEARDILADYRPPNLLRFGFAPLYNTHAEVVTLAEALASVG